MSVERNDDHLIDEIARLHDINKQERALTDDLAADLALFNDKSPALARYREARQQ